MPYIPDEKGQESLEWSTLEAAVASKLRLSELLLSTVS